MCSEEKNVLYHATALENLASIAQSGMRPHSYWASDDEVHDYYLTTVADEAKTPVTLTVRLGDLAEEHRAPDHNGIDEPLCWTLGKEEQEIWDCWSEGDQTWRESLELIGSLRYDAPIPPEKIYCDGRPLTEWLAHSGAAAVSTTERIPQDIR